MFDWMTLLEIKFPLQEPVPIFAIVLFIILLAPVLLRKCGSHPSRFILAGMAIGDHGFQYRCQRAASTSLVPAGLLYIMFLAGLELDMA
jgi:Kef-type K+ transport system membrane component KefB